MRGDGGCTPSSPSGGRSERSTVTPESSSTISSGPWGPTSASQLFAPSCPGWRAVPLSATFEPTVLAIGDAGGRASINSRG